MLLHQICWEGETERRRGRRETEVGEGRGRRGGGREKREDGEREGKRMRRDKNLNEGLMIVWACVYGDSLFHEARTGNSNYLFFAHTKKESMQVS